MKNAGKRSPDADEDGKRLEREEHLKALLQISQALAVPFETGSILQLIADKTSELLKLGSAAIYLLQDQHLYLAATYPPLPKDFPEEFRKADIKDHPHISRAISTREIVLIHDTRNEKLTKAEAEVVGIRNLRSILYAPLLIGERCIGILIPASLQEIRDFQEEEISLFRGFASQAAQTMENTRLYEAEQQNVRQLEEDLSEIRRMSGLIRESEMKFKALFEQAADQIFLLESRPDGLCVVDVNGSASALHGYAKEDLLGKDIFSLEADPPAEDVVAVRKSKLDAGATVLFETFRMCKNGSRYPVEVSMKRIERPDEQALYFSIERDLSERLRLLEQFHQAQKMESVGRLAGGVAHDFNNMLSVIQGYAEMLLAKMSPNDPAHEAITEILSASRKSADLTGQLLAFARKQAITPKVLGLNESVGQLLQMLRRLIGENIGLSWSPQNGLWNVKLDPGQLDQILVNLCVNARDATFGNGMISISTQTMEIHASDQERFPESEPGEYVRLTVSDNGYGMDADTLAHIFEPFFTTKEVGKGTGLGLATVYGIVRQNRGFVTVESVLGKGTSFHIHFPRYKGEDQQEDGKKEKANPVGNKTILIVEDEKQIREMTKLMLEKSGYHVHVAAGASEAIRMLEQSKVRIDLLLTDVVMPGMDGIELAGILQKISPGLRAIFTSGYSEDVMNRHDVKGESIHFLQKPYSWNSLLQKMGEAFTSPPIS